MLIVGAKVATLSASAGLVYGVAAPTSEQSLSFYNIMLIVVLVGGILGYAVTQVRDYKPNKRLREDNTELRRDFDALQKRFDALQKQLNTVLAENDVLKRSRDFDKAIGDARDTILEAIGDLRKEPTV